METPEVQAIRKEIRETWTYVIDLEKQSEVYQVLNRMVARLGYNNKNLPSHVKEINES